MERSAIHLLRKRGKSLRAIAAELGHSKTTVARALSEPVDQPPSRRQRVSLVDPWRSQIAEWLRQGLSGVRMLELARDDPEQPFRGCDSVWRAAVRQERLVLEHGGGTTKRLDRAFHHRRDQPRLPTQAGRCENPAGYDAQRLAGYRPRQVGFVFQFFNLIPTLTAQENAALIAELTGRGRSR